MSIKKHKSSNYKIPKRSNNSSITYCVKPIQQLRNYKSLTIHHFTSLLSRLTRIEKAVKNTTINVTYKVLVYIQISANYMFRPLLVRPSSGWIPSPRKYTIYKYTILYTVIPRLTNMDSANVCFSGCAR